MVRRDIPVILAALWDAAQWQDSISDAHHRSLLPCHRSRKNTATARRAEKQRQKYIKVHDRIRAANKVI
ncbi:MAG: hypothetical protein WC477_07165 [Patescibacteria group bacterium]